MRTVNVEIVSQGSIRISCKVVSKTTPGEEWISQGNHGVNRFSISEVPTEISDEEVRKLVSKHTSEGKKKVTYQYLIDWAAGKIDD